MYSMEFWTDSVLVPNCPFWPVNQKVIRRFATNQIQPSLVELAEFVAHSSVEAKTVN